LAADTVKAIFLTASQVFDAAEVDRVIGRSPCVAMRRKLPRPKVRAEMLFLDVDQVEALAAAVDERYRALVLMAAYSVARAGELKALRTDRMSAPTPAGSESPNTLRRTRRPTGWCSRRRR